MEGVLLRSGGWLLIAVLAMAADGGVRRLGLLGPHDDRRRRGDDRLVVDADPRPIMTRSRSGILEKPADAGRYDDEPIRWGVIATVFWGIAGFLAGLFIALQLAFPALNLGLEYTSFGRLRPLHTSAVIFAFGGNALIATSFYVVQRTCRARLAFPSLARFVFWGYQLFIVLAATGYLLGITAEPRICRARMVCRPVADRRLGRLSGRSSSARSSSASEPHIYVANWFYLAFIVTVAMLHIVNNLSMPVSLVGSKSYSLFAGRAGCADPMVVRPQRGRLLPDRRLPRP